MSNMQSKWRPLMGFVYCLVVVFDFVLAPIMWAVLSVLITGGLSVAWVPLTLAQGGLFHVAMGGVLGVTSWSRGQEKMKGMAENGK